MDKTAVIYWSGTGNTEIMAKEIANGIKSAGAEVQLLNVSNLDSFNIDDFEKIAFGCPSMGNEVLEEDEFEPFFKSIEESLKGKKIALFGSYGWGDGEWMRNWEERVIIMGAKLYNNGLIQNETPDDEGIVQCNRFGEEFSSF